MAEVSHDGSINDDVRWIRRTLTRYPDDPKIHKSVREFIRTHHTGDDRIKFLDALFSDIEIRMILRKGAKYLEHVPALSK